MNAAMSRRVLCFNCRPDPDAGIGVRAHHSNPGEESTACRCGERTCAPSASFCSWKDGTHAERRLCSACRVHVADEFLRPAPWIGEPPRARVSRSGRV